jgi:hypothetical protein
LRALIFGDHALKLQQQLVFRRRRPFRADEQDLDAGARELFDEENLMRIAPAQPIGSIDEPDLDQSFRR